MAERITWIDFAKGFAIISVVLGHALNDDFSLCRLIYIFHMPFFFILAGYLLNLDKWGGAENFKKFSTKLFKRLLVPYYLANILFFPIWFVVCHETGHLPYLWNWALQEPLMSFLEIFVGNGTNRGLILEHMWFLPALFFAEIIFIRLYNRFNKIGEEIFIFAIIFCSLLGLLIGKIIILPLGVDIGIAAQIFLLAGVLIRRYNFVERLNLKICVLLILIVAADFYLNVFVAMNVRRYGDPFLFYAGGLAGTLLVMKISALMTDRKIFSLISDCGRQSMMILFLHLITANVFYGIIIDVLNFPAEKILTNPAMIFSAVTAAVLIPLFVAKKFGRLPVLKNFCA